MEFQQIAIQKLNNILTDKKFSKIEKIENDKIVVKLKDGTRCEVDSWGRITWLNDE